MLLGPLGASFLGSALAGREVIKAGEATFKQVKILMPHYHLTNFEIQTFYQYEPKFKSVYSRHNLSKINDGGIHDKSWWVWINRNSLDCFVYWW